MKVAYCGIDVAKEKSCAQLVSPMGEKIGKPFFFQRAKRGEDGAEKCLKAFEPYDQVVVGTESTGPYGKVLISFFEEEGYPVIEINPIETHDQERRRVRKEKSDPANAYDIAMVTLRKWTSERHFRTAPELLLSRRLTRLRQGLKSNISQLKQLINQDLAIINPGLEKCFKDLWCVSGLAILRKWPTLDRLERAGEKQIAALLKKASRGQFGETKAREILETCRGYRYVQELEHDLGKAIKINADLISKHEVRVEQYTRAIVKAVPTGELELVTSIKSVGDDTGAVLIAESGPGENFRRGDQYVAYVGLDPSVRKSGEWEGRSHISKRGPPAAREALYMAALNGIQHNPVLRLVYLRKLMEGRKKMDALTIVMRYLALIIRSVRYYRRPFYVPEWVTEQLPSVEERFTEWERERKEKEKGKK